MNTDTETETPAAPAHLSDAARQHWAAIMEHWTFDPASLLVLCGGFEAWDLAARARRELDESETITVISDTGMRRQHPALKAFLDASKEARMAFASLRLELPDDNGGVISALHRTHR